MQNCPPRAIHQYAKSRAHNAQVAAIDSVYALNADAVSRVSIATAGDKPAVSQAIAAASARVAKLESDAATLVQQHSVDRAIDEEAVKVARAALHTAR